MYAQPSQTSASQLSYAPTPYSHVPNHNLSATINLDDEVKLADSSTERDLVDSLAEIYSIIQTVDGLEKAYVKDALSENEYSDMCSKLLKQYRQILTDETVAREFGDLDTFTRKWNVECPRAKERLRVMLTGIEVDAVPSRPVTQPAMGPGQLAPSPAMPPPMSGSLILAATENFITFLDALRLNMVTKSALHPLLSDVIQSVNRVTDQDFEHRGKIIQWLITLNQMRTSEELNDDQARDLAFDMEQAYNGFKSIIN